MFTQPETWVAIAFIILMGLFAWLGVHRTVLTALDHRAQRPQSFDAGGGIAEKRLAGEIDVRRHR